MLLTTFSRAVILSVLLLVGQTSWAATRPGRRRRQFQQTDDGNRRRI